MRGGWTWTTQRHLAHQPTDAGVGFSSILLTDFFARRAIEAQWCPSREGEQPLSGEIFGAESRQSPGSDELFPGWKPKDPNDRVGLVGRDNTE